MQMPKLDDTIIAVSSGWRAGPLGIVRLSGGAAFEMAQRVGVTLPAGDTDRRAGWCEASIELGNAIELPATLFWFRSPRSYTGQDTAEIHTVGSLPVLRALSSRLIELGARRALPGEFTARAFLNGRLDAGEVDGVLSLINAEDEASARQAVRAGRRSCHARVAALRARLTELIALVEAGIDFVEEDDVQFITPEELRRSIDDLVGAASVIVDQGGAIHRVGKPHVAFAGLPNAGKSTLFNALLGYERAIVAPVLGTTRDVLSAEIEAGDVAAVLQDCAGRGAGTDELESAAHLAAEQAADQADLVLWVHECTADWDEHELAACRRIPEGRRVLVISKIDQDAGRRPRPEVIAFSATVELSALVGTGLDQLRRTLGQRLDILRCGQSAASPAGHADSALGALRSAGEVASRAGATVGMPEVVAAELRLACEALDGVTRGSLVENVLGAVFSRFCIGK